MKTSPQENFRTLNLVLLICNSFNQLVSERQNLSGILITPECRYWRICIRQKLVCLLILSKVYSKYDIKRISQSIFFQPFAIIFLSQRAYSGQIFPFNSHQVQLSHLWAVLTAEGCWWKPPLSSGKSNRALRAELRIWCKGGSDLGVFAEHKDYQSATPAVSLHRGESPSPRDTRAMLHLLPIFLLITPVLSDFLRKLKFVSPHWLHVFLSFFPTSSLKIIVTRQSWPNLR